MAVKQLQGISAPDGSEYVTLTDGLGNLIGASGPSGGQAVEGTVASGATDAGNPVKVGGRFNTTLPTLTNGQRGDLQIGASGLLNSAVVIATAPVDGASNNSMSTFAAITTGSPTSGTVVIPSSFNGVTWDRQRNNFDTAGLVTISAAGTSTLNSADQVNYNGRGVQVIVDITTATTVTLTVNIQGKDVASGKYYNILSSAALATVSTNQLTVYPGSTTAANLVVSQPLPRTWRVQAVIVGTSVTATIGASVIL